MGEKAVVAKKLSVAENGLIEEMCYTNSDIKISVELNRIRRSMNITEVVSMSQVTRSRIKMGLHKTKCKNSVVIKKENKDKNNGTS